MRRWIEQSPLTVGVALVVAGLVVIFFAWNGAAGVDFPSGQIPYILSGGLTGMALIAGGLTVVLVQSHRRENAAVLAKLDEVVDALRELSGSATQSGPTAVPAAQMVVAGRNTYHRPECRLVANRATAQPMSPAVAEQRGLTPCRICNPPTASAAS